MNVRAGTTLAFFVSALAAAVTFFATPAGALDDSNTPPGADSQRANLLATGAGVDIGILEAGGIPNPDRANATGRVLRSQVFTQTVLPVAADRPAGGPADRDDHATLVTAVAAGSNPTHGGVAPQANVSAAWTSTVDLNNVLASMTFDWNDARGAMSWYNGSYGVRIFNMSRLYDANALVAAVPQNGQAFVMAPGTAAPFSNNALNFAGQQVPTSLQNLQVTMAIGDGDTGSLDFDRGSLTLQLSSPGVGPVQPAVTLDDFGDGTAPFRRNQTGVTPAQSTALLNALAANPSLTGTVVRAAGAAGNDPGQAGNRLSFPAVTGAGNPANATLVLSQDNDNGSNQKARFLDWFTNERDVIFVKSAGNNGVGWGNQSHMLTTPGDAYNGITVGAINGDFSRVAAYSSYWLEGDDGTRPDVRGKPDILAPGGEGPDTGGNNIEQRPNTDPQQIRNMGGTSFAAPHVAGAAALVLDYSDGPGKSVFGLPRVADPNDAGFNVALQPSSTQHNVVKAVILNPAAKDVLDRGIEASDRDYRAGNLGKPTEAWTPSQWSHAAGTNQLTVTRPLDDEQGTGRLSALNTLNQYAAGQHSAGTPETPASVPIRGWDLQTAGEGAATNVYRIQQPLSQGYLTATLVWDRIQAEVDAGTATSRPVQVDAGDTYRDPTSPGPGQVPEALRQFDLKIYRDAVDAEHRIASSVSDVDNVQHLHIPVDRPGTYYLEVETLAGRPQDYALAWYAQPDKPQKTGAVSFTVAPGAEGLSIPPGANNAVGVFGGAAPNDVYALGSSPALPAPFAKTRGGHQLPTGGEIFVSGTGSFDVNPDGTNLDRISGALGNVPRLGPQELPKSKAFGDDGPSPPPATGRGVLGLLPGDGIDALSYGKDSGEVLYFSVGAFSKGAPGSDVNANAVGSPPVPPNPGLVAPINPGGGDPGHEAASDIYASQTFASFGRYGKEHLMFGKIAPLVAQPGGNRLLYDEAELGLQAPTGNGSALDAPEDDLRDFELSDPSDPYWGVDFNQDGVLEPWENPIWFSLDRLSPSVTNPNPNPLLFTDSADPLVSADDILETPPGRGEDVNGNGLLDADEDFDGDGVLDSFTFGIYASGVADIGLLLGDELDALALSDGRRIGWLDKGFDEALFSLDPDSPSLGTFGVSPADVFYTDFLRPFAPTVAWLLGGSLYARHDQLGLLFTDNTDGLDTRPIPEPSTLALLLSGIIGFAALRRRRICSCRPVARNTPPD